MPNSHFQDSALRFSGGSFGSPLPAGSIGMMSFAIPVSAHFGNLLLMGAIAGDLVGHSVAGLLVREQSAIFCAFPDM
jgi:hypothetical protein